jgi:flavin reductase (DIM6/NTAB) family NADH-FMN oxidoreductase RutF
MIDPATLTDNERYQLLISCVVPRPIALVTTLSSRGVVNAAPFSFFNAVSANPPILLIAVDRRKGRMKDTAANIVSTQEFVVHIVDEEIAQKMNITSASFPPEVSEAQAAEFSLLPSERVMPPRLAESPIHMECRLLQHLELGNGPIDALFGEVVAFHIRDELLRDGKVDPSKLKAIGRLGGPTYCRTNDLFEMVRPIVPPPTGGP